MRTLYISLILTFQFSLNFVYSTAQIRANFIENSTRPTDLEIEEYRNSIWEKLPIPDGWINDYEGIFSLTEEDSLTEIITRHKNKTKIEISIVTVDSIMVRLDKFDKFADHLLKTWRIGNEKGNGILICISSQHRKIAISRGPGEDIILSDLIIRQLISKKFIPLFRKNNYYGGTFEGLTALIKLLQQSPELAD